MPTYQYLAYDKAGKELKSSSAADSQRQLRRELADRGLFVSEIKEISAAREKGLRWFKPRVSHSDLSLIIRQLAILVNSGMQRNTHTNSSGAEADITTSWKLSLMTAEHQCGTL